MRVTSSARRAFSRPRWKSIQLHWTVRHFSGFSDNSKFFQVSKEVQQAIQEERPVVALETTIYTHGFPYPDNLALASRLESVVRHSGGIPATIGVLDGVAKVGFTTDELKRLVSCVEERPQNLLKISRRDFGFALGLKGPDGQSFSGGTTISGTMVLAHLAGIKVFGTGGLGGVHRGAEQTMDVSADLTELGRTPVAVISSGCKAFLDIPKTLEYLETQGVGVATFADGRKGQVDLPGFWSRDSGVRSPVTIEHETDAAKVIYAHDRLGLQSGLFFANPIPEAYSIPLPTMQSAIQQAIRDAEAAGATGAASTPYILDRIKQLTGKRSIEANRALVESNVARATRVAKELCRLEAEGSGSIDIASDSGPRIIGPAAVNFTVDGVSKGVMSQSRLPPHSSQAGLQDTANLEPNATPDVFVAGIMAVDFACDYTPRSRSSPDGPELYTSNPARIVQSLGGVGHNVARAAHLMGTDVRLCSAVADDLSGKAAVRALITEGISDAGIKSLPSPPNRTAQYVSVNDTKKDLVLAMADMSILEQTASGAGSIADTFETFWLPQLQSAKPSHLVLDANWPPSHLARWLQAGADINAHVTFEPVSNAKAAGLFQLPSPYKLSVYPRASVHLSTPNAYELAAMFEAAKASGALDRPDWWQVTDAFGIPNSGARVQFALATTPELVDRGVPQQSIQLLPFIPIICTKLGERGVLLTQLLPAGDPRLSSDQYAPHILFRGANGSEESLGVGGVYMRLFHAAEEVRQEDVVSVNGVGDTFAGSLVAGLARRGKHGRVEDLVDLAQRAACLTLRSSEAVSPGLGTLGMLL